MKKITALLFITTLSVNLALACTTFFINKNGQMVFGRNYDWLTGSGMVCTNQRGLAKVADKTAEGQPASWVSQYGSITFNQYGKEFPTGGMNEKGLVVELMWLDGTQYPVADKRPTVGVLQWIQYQLDNCATVNELIGVESKIRISDDTPLHYLVADATGNVATIEFLEGKMVVHKGSDLPLAVLTNDSYASSLFQTKSATAVSGGTQSFTNNSIDRFAQTCNKVKNYQQSTINRPLVDYSFDILDQVAQGTHTKWSIVYDITNKKIHFKTLDYTSVKQVDFSGFNFSCATASKAWDMNQTGKGEVTNQFGDFSLDINMKIVNRSFDESSSQFTVSEEGRKQTWQYASKITCVKAR